MKSYQLKVFFLLALLIGAIGSSFSQKRMDFGFELQNHLENCDPEDRIPLLIEGNGYLNEAIINAFEGRVRLQIDQLFSIDIPAKRIPSFSNNELVKVIEFSSQPGRSLNDTMLINTNVDSIIQMSQPLRSSYTGKGVLMGFIDSGIEINHPDFQDSSGNTRIYSIWDQGVPYQPSQQANNYFYGIEWDSSSINNGTCTHDDKAQEFGHGSMVTGAAASNGLSSNSYRGVAPEVSIISVATNFNALNWLQTVAEAVDYIYSKADSLGMPCVINASVGTYIGSHDGKDIAARMIDQMIKQRSGRAFVCAAGNAGNQSFHVQHLNQQDSSFTWFEHSNSLFSGRGGVGFEFWGDSIDFDSLTFAFGADEENNGVYSFRGQTAYAHPIQRLNQLYRDSIIGASGNHLAYIDTYCEFNQGRYKVEVAIIDPDSSNYLFSLMTKGSGKIDLWSQRSLTNSSNLIQQNLPTVSTYPKMSWYQIPDTFQTMVSSFTCLPSAVTVGNYVNRNTYVDFNGNLKNMNATPGLISSNSSWGPNRSGVHKPDISSAGDFMLSSGRIGTLNSLKTAEPGKISIDGWHMRNGGTSMASPTVAGILALYLEMCPNTSAADLSNKLRMSAKKDVFTGTNNDFQYGFGKANAFQLLKLDAFSPSLISLNASYCDGDTAILQTTIPFALYFWNTGDSLSNLPVTASGIYFAKVQKANSCIANTDSMLFTFNSLPNKPIISQSNDTFNVSGPGPFQWFRNNNLIPGALNQQYIASQPGNFHCRNTDTNTGCMNFSDTLAFGITQLDQLSLEHFKYWPNPVSDQLFIETYKEDTNVELLNSLGQVVWSNKIRMIERFSIKMGLYPNGLYFLKIESVKEKFILKVIKQ